MIDFETFTKMPKNVRYLGKLIVAEGFKKLPKVQKIAKSGHTTWEHFLFVSLYSINSTNLQNGVHYLAQFGNRKTFS